MRTAFKLFLILSLFALVGCQSSLMAKTAEGVKPYSPNPDKATIVFMRPSSFGGGIQASIYMYDNMPEFVGIISSGNKLTNQTNAGKHTFMVVGENADFMEADLAAGHIYYVEIEPHFGFMKTRFSLEPIPQTEFDTEDFKKDLAACHFVQNTPLSQQWFTEHYNDIVKKHDYYFGKWQAKPEADKNRLLPADGRPL